jgi:hypothetical protein
MLRRLLRPVWFFLALIFLLEAWLWDHLEPVVARLVALVPLRKFKFWLAQRIDTFSPLMTLLVFAVPVIVLFPLKLLGVWFIANQYWFSAIGLMVFGKLVGVGVSAFIFDVTRPKLLQMPWFHKLYEFVLDVRQRAAVLVAPARERIAAFIATLKAGSSSRLMRTIQRIRRRVRSAR